MVRLDPEATVSMTAIYTIADGDIPLASSVLVSLMDFFGAVFEYGSKRDLVEATFRWPLLLVLQSNGYEARKTIAAVTVARYFDELVRRKVVQARDTFPRGLVLADIKRIRCGRLDLL